MGESVLIIWQWLKEILVIIWSGSKEIIPLFVYWITKILNPNLTNTYFLGQSAWEWLKITGGPLIIALGTVFGGGFINIYLKKRDEQQKVFDKEIEEDRLRQDTLIKYFDQMTQLILRPDWPKPNETPKNTINTSTDIPIIALAKARTFAVLNELDGRRKGSLFIFLYESKALQHISLEKSNLSSSYLHNADLSNTRLIGTDLSGADLRHADLQGADLQGADLRGANLIDANLRNVRFRNTIIADETQIHPKWKLVHELVNKDGVEKDLSNNDLSHAHLSGANLSGANLSSAKLLCINLSHADLSGANLSYANLSGANLFSTDLSYADLRKANLRKADLRHADLSHADLSGADLIDADLDGTDLNGAIMLNTDLRQTKNLTRPQLVGKEPPLICNSPLPQNIKINPNRDCDQIAAAIQEDHPMSFLSLDKAKKYVQEQRHKTWK